MILEFISDASQVIFLLAAYFYLFKDKMLAKFSKTNQKIFLFFKDSCKIRFNTLFTSILLPLLLIGGFWYYLLCTPSKYIAESFTIYHNVSSIIVAPFFEEFIFRGIILASIVSFVLFLEIHKLGMKNNIITRFSASSVGFLIVSIAFSLSHAGKLDLRYLNGAIFCFVYLLDKRNLLPAILAHALNNFMVFYVAYCSFWYHNSENPPENSQ